MCSAHFSWVLLRCVCVFCIKACLREREREIYIYMWLFGFSGASGNSGWLPCGLIWRRFSSYPQQSHQQRITLHRVIPTLANCIQLAIWLGSIGAHSGGRRRKKEEGGKERRREGVSKTRKEELQSRRVAVRTLWNHINQMSAAMIAVACRRTP